MTNVHNVVKKNNIFRRQVWIRRLALLFLVCFFIAFLATRIVIVANINHDCIGDGCPICKLIHSAGKLLKQIGRILVSISGVPAALLIIPMAMIATGLLYHYFSSPITAKIRLNN